MVTEAGKELLRNSISTANFHNRILEENEMWKQWELECGLTMMVSDDDIVRKIKKSHQCSKHRRRDRSRDRDNSRDRKYKSEGTVQSSAGSSASSDRWDHSGFRELYPDVVVPDKVPSSSPSHSHLKKHKKKKRKHCRRSSTSDNEIWEEFKKYKRSKKEKEKLNPDLQKETYSGYNNHVKEWKKLKEKAKS